MRWKKRQTQAQIRRELESGEWSYSHEFSLCDTAKEWGRRPSEFGLCAPEDDYAVMLAYTRTVATMRAKEALEQRRAAEKQSRAGGPARRRARR